MKLNITKTKAIVFSIAPIPPKLPLLYLEGATIEEVDTYKYLGAWVDRKLVWNVHTKKKISEAKQALGSLSRCRRYLPPSVTRLVYKTIIQPQFLYAISITYPKNKKDQISLEYVNKYAASLISDKHTGLYDDLLITANLHPIWKIVVDRRVSQLRSYVDGKRFIPEGFLTLVEPSSRPGLRSSDARPNVNMKSFAPPIYSRRQQCERTALSEMIRLWNALPSSQIALTSNSFRSNIKNGEITQSLIKSKTIQPLIVPVRYPTWP